MNKNSGFIKQFFSPAGFWQGPALSLARILAGLFMAYHGYEIFDGKKMDDYEKWMGELEYSNPAFMAYLGKGLELASGILLILGLFTRIALLAMAGTMSGICFGLGQGRIFMEDQHPFLFILIAFVLFFTGPGKWSLDHVFFHPSNH